MHNGQPFCNNDEFCLDNKQNVTFKCPLWKAYCGEFADNGNSASNITNKPPNNDTNELKTNVAKLDDMTRTVHAHLCHYFLLKDSVELRHAIPGISSSRPITGTLYRHEAEQSFYSKVYGQAKIHYICFFLLLIWASINTRITFRLRFFN